MRSGRTGVSSLSFRTNGPLAKYFCRPALRDSVRMLTVFQQKLYSIFFITSPLPSKKKTRHFESGEWFMTIPLTIVSSFILVIFQHRGRRHQKRQLMTVSLLTIPAASLLQKMNTKFPRIFCTFLKQSEVAYKQRISTRVRHQNISA